MLTECNQREERARLLLTSPLQLVGVSSALTPAVKDTSIERMVEESEGSQRRDTQMFLARFRGRWIPLASFQSVFLSALRDGASTNGITWGFIAIILALRARLLFSMIGSPPPPRPPPPPRLPPPTGPFTTPGPLPVLTMDGPAPIVPPLIMTILGGGALGGSIGGSPVRSGFTCRLSGLRA